MSDFSAVNERVAALIKQPVHYIDDAGRTKTITAAIFDPASERFAYVQADRQDLGGHVDIAFILRVCQGDTVLAAWELDSYNPYSGCTVYWMDWVGDCVLVAYEEKHRQMLACVPIVGPAKLLEASRDIECRQDRVYYRLPSTGLAFAVDVRSMESLFPVPITWLNEGQPLPTLAQHRSPTDVPAFQRHLVRRCFGDHAPQPWADFLLGSFTHWHWHNRPVAALTYHGASYSSLDYLQWFPLFRYQMLPSEEEAQQYLHLLDQLAAMPIAERDDDSTALDWATESAAATVRYWAGEVATACRANQFPLRTSCFFWVGEHSLNKLMAALPAFPPGYEPLVAELLPHRDQWADFCHRESHRQSAIIREQYLARRT